MKALKRGSGNSVLLVAMAVLVMISLLFMIVSTVRQECLREKSTSEEKIAELKKVIDNEEIENKKLIDSIKELQSKITVISSTIVNNQKVDDTVENNNTEKPAIVAIKEKKENKIPVSNGNENSVVIPIIIFSHNRGHYLKRSLESVFRYMKTTNNNNNNNNDQSSTSALFPIYVSQDSMDASIDAAVNEFNVNQQQKRVTLLRYIDNSIPFVPPGEQLHYHLISRHYKWGLGQIFDQLHYKQVIILEEDIEIAPDFFEYFQAMLTLLRKDKTLMCVTGWNDNGIGKYIVDNEELYRSDFFGGLGWMMTDDIWKEWGPKWPSGYWDDWIREPPQRNGRACIRPEISRTHTFGEQGASGGQFYSFLSQNVLNSKPVPWLLTDVSYLEKDSYDKEFLASVRNARTVSMIDFMNSLNPATVLKEDKRLIYRNDEEFVNYANQLGIMSDFKAFVPRTGYMGVVTLRSPNSLAYLFIVPEKVIS